MEIQDRMTPAFRHMSSSLNIVISSFERMSMVSNNAVLSQGLRSARTELGQVDIILNDIESSTIAATNQQRNFNNAIRGGHSAADGLINKIKGYGAAYLGLSGARKAMEATDMNTNNKARLGMITESLEEQIALQKQVYNAAQRSRSSYNDTSASVAKLGLLAGDAFGSNDETVRFAELMNKSFKVSGASIQEQTAGMYQLTQAMAAGKLQGDEFRSIMENAPMLASAIAEFTDRSKGELKDMSREGTITSDIIKNALFSAGDEIEARFATMPKTFADIWVGIKNTAMVQFSEVFQGLNNAINSDVGATVINNISNSMFNLAQMVMYIGSVAGSVGSFFVENWNLISPAIGGVTGALLIYKGAVLAGAVATGVASFANSVHAISTYASCKALAASELAGLGVVTARTAERMATAQATAAQWGFNASLLSCPILWVIMIIGAIIVALGSWYVKNNGLKVSVLQLWNTIATAWDNIKLSTMKLVNGVIESWNEMKLRIGGFVNGILNYLGELDIKGLTTIQNFANGAIDIINDLIRAANKIPGVAIETFNHVTWGVDFAINEEAKRKARDANFAEDMQKAEDDKIIHEMNYQASLRSNEAEKQARERGISKAEQEKNEAFNNSMETQISTAQTPNYSQQTADNTARMADSMEMADEDLKYLRDMAEREIINRFTTAEIKVDMTNYNEIKENRDIDGIMSYFKNALDESMNTMAEGV